MWELLEWQDPDLTTTSPPCDPFSPTQALNRHKHTEQSWQAMRERGLRHLRVCMKVCMHRYHRHRYFLHEHPYLASSWREPMVDNVLSMPGVILILSHMCKFGKVASRQLSDGIIRLSKKPEGIMTNSPEIAFEVDVRCDHPLKHTYPRCMDGATNPASGHQDSVGRSYEVYEGN